MEKIVRKVRIGFIHLGFWTLYAFLLFILFNFMIQGRVNADHELYTNIFLWFLTFPAIASYLVYYSLIFKYYQKSRKTINSLLLAFVASFMIALVFVLGLEFTLESDLSIDRIKNVTLSLYLFEVFLCSVVGGIAFVIRAFEAWFKDQELKEELNEKNHKMELELVKSQLDPHFLFNSLNNIDVLIQKDPKLASDYLNKLADLLRYTLHAGKEEMVDLKEEIDHLKKYIELQSIRTSQKELVDLKLKGSFDSLRIAPFLFIPFIENAFKYHQYSDSNAKISMEVESDQNGIHFTCSNQVSKEKGSGFSSFQLGNELITKRLELLYPGKHQLDIRSEEGIYKVTLVLR